MYKAKGIILAAYNYGGGMHFTQLTQEERIETAIRQGEKVHPNYRGLVERGITIAMASNEPYARLFGALAKEPQRFYARRRTIVPNFTPAGRQ